MKMIELNSDDVPSAPCTSPGTRRRLLRQIGQEILATGKIASPELEVRRRLLWIMSFVKRTL